MKKNMKNFKIVIVSDIPKYSRIVEAIFLFFSNPRRLIQGVTNFLYKKEPYTKLQFNHYLQNNNHLSQFFFYLLYYLWQIL